MSNNQRTRSVSDEEIIARKQSFAKSNFQREEIVNLKAREKKIFPKSRRHQNLRRRKTVLCRRALNIENSLNLYSKNLTPHVFAGGYEYSAVGAQAAPAHISIQSTTSTAISG
jgi:hypothetical protein